MTIESQMFQEDTSEDASRFCTASVNEEKNITSDKNEPIDFGSNSHSLKVASFFYIVYKSSVILEKELSSAKVAADKINYSKLNLALKTIGKYWKRFANKIKYQIDQNDKIHWQTCFQRAGGKYAQRDTFDRVVFYFFQTYFIYLFFFC